MRTKYRGNGHKSSGRASAEIVDRQEVLSGRVSVELPVTLAEVVQGVSEEIEQLAGQAGLLIMRHVMEAEIAGLVGVKGRHDAERKLYRWGSQRGYAVLAGRKVRMKRPRVRDAEGREVGLQSYLRFQSPPRRRKSIVKQLIHGVSTRKYERAIEDFTAGYGISKSAVSREFIEASRGSLKALCERRIDELGRLAVLMIDGVDFAGQCIVVALGVDAEGRKHILGLAQGATENSTVVQQMLDDLVERGLDTRRRMLIVLDGSKALRKAVKNTFGAAGVVQRCHLHKRRNVMDLLANEYQASADQRIRTAHAMKDYRKAKAQLLKTVEWLEGINPSAAASLREGLEETLTVHRLGLPELLRKSVQSTNLIESAIHTTRTLTNRVKRWSGKDMRLRWSASGLLAAEKRFRRVRGCKLMASLIEALDKADAVLADQSEAA